MTNIQWFLILFMGSLWGGSFYFTEFLLQFINVYMVVFLRLIIAWFILLVLSLCVHRGPVVTKDGMFGISWYIIGNLAVMSLFAASLPFMMIVYGQQYITGGQASIFNAMTAFSSMSIAVIFIPEEKLTWNRLLGIILGLTGVVCAIGYQELLAFSPTSLGSFMVLFATVLYGIGAVCGRLRVGNVPHIPSAMFINFFASVVLLFVVYMGGHFEFSNMTPFLYVNAVLYALCSSVLAFILLMYLLPKVGAGNIGISTFAACPSAIMLGYVFLGETITVLQIVGFGIIALGLVVLDGRFFTKKV